MLDVATPFAPVLKKWFAKNAQKKTPLRLFVMKQEYLHDLLERITKDLTKVHNYSRVLYYILPNYGLLTL